MESLISDLKTAHDYLTEAIPRTESASPKSSYPNYQAARQKWQAEVDKYKNGLEEIKNLQSKFTANSTSDQSEIIKTRTEIREK